jgi:flavin-dependent dehydrogenase
MTSSPFDVVIVGAGCAGLTAAVALARAGFQVAVVEAVPAGHAGNPSGGVYFAENLAHPDVLGPEAVAALPWERRLVERGRFATDGQALLGITYRDSAAFSQCYTVLRPAVDAALAAVAERYGAVLFQGAPVESLIREAGRVIGVCTSAMTLYGRLVFLAEGDTAHLVTREGCERSPDPRDAPRFLMGLQRIFDLPPGAVEARFGLTAGEGVAYDFLLRNGSVGGRMVPLNLRGWLCTNKQGLTLGLLISTENLRRHFDGNPAALLDWLAELPALRPWLRDGRPAAALARLLRGGGARDVPHLVADGLAIGGAAAALGVTFPFVNFTGPATATGLLLAQAAARIRAEGGEFTRDALARHYAGPLSHTHYWKDLEYLRRWPGFMRKTHHLFDRDLDLLLGTARAWTRPRRWWPSKALAWVGLLGRSGGWSVWSDVQEDLRALGRGLRLRGLAGRPALGRLLLDGALNALRDLGGRPRINVPPAGRLEVHYHPGGEETAGAPPRFLQRWLEHSRPVLGAAIAVVVRNDTLALSEKVKRAVRLLVRQINLLDLVGATVLWVLAWVAGGIAATVRRRRPASARTTEKCENRCVPFSRSDSLVPQVHLLWPRTLPEDQSLVREGLERVCPGGVFEVHQAPQAPTEVRVHPERCVACEACWRTSRLVDWDRPLPAAEPTPRSTGVPPVAASHRRDACATGLAAGPHELLDRMEAKLDAYDAALARGPHTLDRARADHLEMLARYAQQLAAQLARSFEEGLAAGKPGTGPLFVLAEELAEVAEERTQRTWDGRFWWAASDGRQIRQHHLAALRRLLPPAGNPSGVPKAAVGGPPSPRTSAAALVKGLYRGLAERAAQEPPAEDAPRLLLAGAAAAAALLDAFDPAPPAGLSRADARLRADLLQAVALETLDTLAHAAVDLGPAAEDFHRQAGDLLTRAPSPAGAYRRYARRLIDGRLKARTLLRVEGDFATLIQRQALLPEHEEIERATERVGRLAEAWEEGRGAADEAAFDAEIAEQIGRQEARLAACKLLLLDTHARLEANPDAALEMALLRVVLDDAEADLEVVAARVQRRLEPANRFRLRPLVEPGLDLPPATAQEYLREPDDYRSGDFLLAPVDLVRARLTPEMLGDQPLPPSPEGPAEWSAVVEHLRGVLASCQDARPRRRRSLSEGRRALAFAWRTDRLEEDLFVAAALASETAGRAAHSRAAAAPLEAACTRFVAARLLRHASRLGSDILPHDRYAPERGTGFARERTGVLAQLRTLLTSPRAAGAQASTLRHVGPEALEQEAVKADVRRQAETVVGLLRDAGESEPGLRLLGLALAGAVAWLWAADCTLGRLAWMACSHLAEHPDDPVPLPLAGRRAFGRCLVEIRTRVRRLDEDLAALHRGYWPPQARAAALILPSAAGAVSGKIPRLLLAEAGSADVQ